MRHPVKMHKWCAGKIMKTYSPLSQVEEVLRRHVQDPALLKWMEKSHVSRGFYLALHTPFCRQHLPVEDTIMVLETVDGHRYETKFLAQSNPCGLSGGWRRFAIDMKLEQGDGVVFHLVAPTKFKVYFICSEDEVHLSFHHPNLVIQPKTKRSALSVEDLQEKQKVWKADKFWSKVLLISQRKLKRLYADKIRRKYLPFFQVSRKSNLVEARRIQSKLDGEHPPVVVRWLRNWNVFHNPSLVLPRSFCIAHLAKVVTTMVLETETGEQYETKYLPHVRRLSAGWVMFAKKMNLKEGDAIVFHLVEPATFKVYVIRANCESEVRLPFHLLKLVLHAKRRVSRIANTSPLNFYKASQVHHIYLQGKQNVLRADKIWSKYSNEVLRKCLLDHGKRFQSNLNIEHLITMKRVFKSNVCSFYMTLPSAYCKAHLPSVDTIILLETETGEQYEAKYLHRTCRLTGGWGRFAKDMKLEGGDSVIFHLVEAAKFKVYVIRADSADEAKLPPHIQTSVNLLKESISSKAESNQLTVYRSGKAHQRYLHGVQKESKAYRIWKENLRRSQLGQVKSHLVQSKLNAECPITVRWLQQCYISRGFNLPLPTQFCRAYLPSDDTTMALETELGEKYESTYLAQCSSLTGGWRRFASNKKLETGDAVIFHLVEATKFKVYIIRANSNEVNLPVHLLQLLTDVGRRISSKASKPLIVYSRRKEHQIAENYSWKNVSLNFAEDFVLFLEGTQFSDIKSFRDFKAVLYELHELPNHVLHDYYKLCCSQKAFLHAHLFSGINPRLNTQTTVDAIRRIILNTVNLANALSACKLSTFLHEYALWDKTLKTYKALGMNVGFLCARLHHLKNLAVSLEGASDRVRYEEAYHERGRAKCEARKLELMLAKLKNMQTLKLNTLQKNYKEMCSWLECVKAEISYLENLMAESRKFFAEYDAHIETLKLKAKIHAHKFREEVSAPWLDCSGL